MSNESLILKVRSNLVKTHSLAAVLSSLSSFLLFDSDSFYALGFACRFKLFLGSCLRWFYSQNLLHPCLHLANRRPFNWILVPAILNQLGERLRTVSWNFFPLAFFYSFHKNYLIHYFFERIFSGCDFPENDS